MISKNTLPELKLLNTTDLHKQLHEQRQSGRPLYGDNVVNMLNRNNFHIFHYRELKLMDTRSS